MIHVQETYVFLDYLCLYVYKHMEFSCMYKNDVFQMLLRVSERRGQQRGREGNR